MFQADCLRAKHSEGVVHLSLTLLDPSLALHEARELLQAVPRGNGPRWRRGNFRASGTIGGVMSEAGNDGSGKKSIEGRRWREEVCNVISKGRKCLCTSVLSVATLINFALTTSLSAQIAKWLANS